MYAEIKSTDKILINRLDENEQILLEEMYKKGILPSSKLGLDQLTDESGDFGGVMLTFSSSESENKEIEIITEIPNSLTIPVGTVYDLPVETNITDTTQIICTGTSDLNIINMIGNNSGINFNANALTNSSKIYYTIAGEGYNPITKSIDVNIIPKNVQRVYLYPYDESGNYIEGFDGISYTISDESGTEYITSYDEAYNCFYVDLPIGRYNMTFEIIDYEPVEYLDYDITQDMMNNPSTISLDIRFETPANLQY